MSTATVDPQVRTRPASKIPPPLPASAKAARTKGPNVWERWSVVLSTAFGISTALHLILLLALAFLMLSYTVDERLAIDSGLALSTEAPAVDLTELNLKAAPAPETETQRQHTAIVLDAANARRNDGPDTEIEIPDVGGGGKGTNGSGSAGKGIFGTGREANSFVFVVDCSDSMRVEERFERAVKELQRVVKSLKAKQKFFVIFYNNNAIPMYDKQQTRANRFRNRRRFGRRSTKKKSTRRYRLVSAIESVKHRAASWIRRIKPEGGTEPGESLRIALSMKPEVIYFLTDGEIPEDTGDVIRVANQSRVRVNTVALGYAGSAKLLETIAKENSGTFRFVK